MGFVPWPSPRPPPPRAPSPPRPRPSSAASCSCRAAARCPPTRPTTGGAFATSCRPGQNGLINAPELGAFAATGARPPHSDDQLKMYGDLVYATPGIQAASARRLLQGRQLRRQARRRGALLLAAVGRDDRARQGLRRPAHLRDDPRRHDVRRGLRGRRGPALLHGRAAQPRPRHAVLVRRRRAATARWTATSGCRRPTPRPTSSARSTSSTTSTAPRARQIQEDVAAYVEGVNAYIAARQVQPAAAARRVRGDRQDRARAAGPPAT